MKASEGFLDAIEAMMGESAEMDEIVQQYWVMDDAGNWHGEELSDDDATRIRELRHELAESLRRIDRMMEV